MTWWYENEEEEMKLYKNEDLCIECKNEFFSKPYDPRDPTPGQLGYCIKCDNCLIKEKKMEFDKSRCYSAINADELRAGDKVITARCMADLKTWVEADAEPNVIELIQDETNTNRFTCKCFGSNKTYDTSLAYLVERAEPKTEHDCQSCKYKNCGFKYLNTKNECDKYEQKAEKHADYNHCEEARKAYACAMTNACPNKHYRPFNDSNELIKVWMDGGKYDYKEMPHIWVRYKMNQCGQMGILITKFEKNYVQIDGNMIAMHALMADYEFLDGSPCGVEV
jgi:hypothetical protein